MDKMTAGQSGVCEKFLEGRMALRFPAFERDGWGENQRICWKIEEEG